MLHTKYQDSSPSGFHCVSQCINVTEYDQNTTILLCRLTHGTMRKFQRTLIAHKLCDLQDEATLTTEQHMSSGMRFPTMWFVRPAKPQISLRMRAV